MENELRGFLDSLETKSRPISLELSRESWLAQTTGLKEHLDQAAALRTRLMQIYSDPEAFALLKRYHGSGEVQDSLLIRQVDVAYRSYLPNQIDPAVIRELVAMQAAISGDFVNYRAVIDGEKVADNRILDILQHERDEDLRRKAWEASKQIGSIVVGKVLELVRLRNRVARTLGFADYYAMSLQLAELDEKELFDTFDRLARLTDAPFSEVKKGLDQSISARFGLSAANLRPWHYSDPFFQEAPDGGGFDLSAFYAQRDLVGLAVRYYDGIGLEVRDILSRSDLFEREGKCQHAFCTDMDREGDVRILTNLRPDAKWMTTLLHELGHAVYSKNVSRELPFMLRTSAHTLATEAVAQLNGRMSQTSAFLSGVVGVPDDKARAVSRDVESHLRTAQLIFARWGMTVAYFERAMYRDPDQDLNTLWWDLVSRMQGLTRPEGRNAPDWAAKIHLANYPAYYQNYVLGEMMASQLWSYITREVVRAESIVGRPETGRFLIERVFAPGARHHWNVMLEKATGEPLNPEYFVRQFVG